MADNDIIRIKEILTGKGMSVQDLANETGLSYTYTSEVVRNVKFPRPDNLKLIAQALDVDLKDLFVSTKEENLKPIFEKDQEGNYIEIGYLKNSSTE